MHPDSQIPGNQRRDDVCDGAVELVEELFDGTGDGQLLPEVLRPPDLLSVLPNGFGQLLTPVSHR